MVASLTGDARVEGEGEGKARGMGGGSGGEGEVCPSVEGSHRLS